jgi:hypothetical protein
MPWLTTVLGSLPKLFGTTQDQLASRTVTTAKMTKPMIMKSDNATAPALTDSRNAFMIRHARSANSDPIIQRNHHP